MSALKNYDLRLDYTPYTGALWSVSYFKKDIEDPIEFEQGYANIGSYTYPTNYPEGELSGFELEARQQMGRFVENLTGLSLGANATFIDSEVTLPADEARYLAEAGVPSPTRDMSNAPEHLYNIFLTYDVTPATTLGLFYTVRGDTLIAGGRADAGGGSYIPNVYETEFGTLNFSLSHRIRENVKLKFQAKNLLDPKIESVYRSDYIGGDVLKTSDRKGMEFSLSVSAEY
jgi:outer membrane receptor protein involved in Fe transport